MIIFLSFFFYLCLFASFSLFPNFPLCQQAVRMLFSLLLLLACTLVTPLKWSPNGAVGVMTKEGMEIEPFPDSLTNHRTARSSPWGSDRYIANWCKLVIICHPSTPEQKKCMKRYRKCQKDTRYKPRPTNCKWILLECVELGE